MLTVKGLIRSCNMVVTDLRLRLKPENAETLNIIYFSRNEEIEANNFNPLKDLHGGFEELGHPDGEDEGSLLMELGF